MRRLLSIVFLLGSPAMSADWRPINPIEIVVPNAPGGGNDAVGRLLQRVWQERKLTPAAGVVVNKTGGGGTVALNYLNQKPNDPHAMAVVSITQQLNYIVGSSPLRHRDFTPLAVMIGDFIGFAVRADSPLMNGRDLIERLKKDPASLSAGVTAIGGNNHIAYVLAALLGGHIDLHMGSVGPLTKHLEAGRVRIIAVTSDKRLTGPFATIPTWKEQGIAGTFNTWRGLWAPKGLSAEQIAFWDEALEKVSRDAHWKETLDANHWDGDYRNSRDTMRYLDGVHVELRDVLKELGLAKRLD